LDYIFPYFQGGSTYRQINSLSISGPTVCVSGLRAGWENAWEQEKLEAGKMLENGTNPTYSVHAVLDRRYLRAIYLEKQEPI
jgi:hypothetical protein